MNETTVDAGSTGVLRHERAHEAVRRGSWLDRRSAAVSPVPGGVIYSRAGGDVVCALPAACRRRADPVPRDVDPNPDPVGARALAPDPDRHPGARPGRSAGAGPYPADSRRDP